MERRDWGIFSQLMFQPWPTTDLKIILWLNHLTADLRHIDNKNLKKKNISKMFETMTPATIWSFQQKWTKGHLIPEILLYK